ncbi:MAG TPA: type II toxin-antitoxin system prevent-host-death family antitoxin [Acidimicrobiales bacterium]
MNVLSATDARNHFKEVLDAATDGRSTIVRRDGRDDAAIVDLARLRYALEQLLPRADAVSEAGGWSLFIPGLPIAADAEAFDDAVEEMVEALREYAEDWTTRLRHAPNHANNWGVVQFVYLSDDAELRTWIAGAPTER